MDSDLPDPLTLRGILKGGPTLNEIRGNTCDELRDELLTACIETHTYRELFQRCMELVERYEPKAPPAEQSVESEDQGHRG